MNEPARIVVTPFELAHVDAWRGLFDRAASSCFCRFWHFGGDKNGWQARMAFEPERNVDEARDAVRDDDGTMRGLVAWSAEGREVVGWIKVAPKETLAKLTKLGAYRGHHERRQLASDANDNAPRDREVAYAIGCMLVDPAARGTGIARALILAAPGYARERGATRLEAYPRRFEGRLPDEQAFLGPESLLVDAGFTPIADPLAVSDAYPVYEHRLG